MCTSSGSRSFHEPFCSHGYELVKGNAKRPKYAVLVHGGSRCKDNCCVKVTVSNIDTMEELPRRAYVKAHRFPQGSAMCFGEFQFDCPFIFVSGGDGENARTINVYDVLLDKWRKLGDLNRPRSHHRMHCVDKQLYIIGGICDGLIEMYDLVKGDKSDKITKGRQTAVRACLKVKVHDFPSVVFDGKIYVFGGVSDHRPVKCVQYFNTASHSSVVAQLPDDLPCECHGGAAVVLGNKVYIATPQGKLIQFDPMTGLSRLCADQPFKRTNFALVERNNKLHVFGGKVAACTCNNNRSCRPKDLVYDTRVNVWSAIETNSHVQPLVVSASCVVEYSKTCLFTPFHEDLYSNIPRSCRHAKL